MRADRRPTRALGPLLVLMLGVAPSIGAETAASDRRAVAIADQVMTALGGKQRWDRLRVLRWTFEVSVNDTLRPARRHSWDKHTGWHRVDGTTAAGQPFCYIENLNDSTGMAWVSRVSMNPGAIALTRMFREANSFATAFVRPISPALLAA